MKQYEAEISFVNKKAKYILYPSAENEKEAEKKAREIITKYEPNLTIKKVKLRGGIKF